MQTLRFWTLSLTLLAFGAISCSFSAAPGEKQLNATPAPIVDDPDFVNLCAPSDFAQIVDNLSGKFELMCDVDLAGLTIPVLSKAPAGANPLVPFSGIFEGHNYTIKNLNFSNLSWNNSMGLFPENAGEIRNLVIKNFTLQSNHDNGTGILVGKNTPSGKIKNVRVEGGKLTIPAGLVNPVFYFGGMVGINEGTMENVFASAEIEVLTVGASLSIGGLVGLNEGKINVAETEVNIKGGGGNIGGIVGQQDGYVTPTMENVAGELRKGKSKGTIVGEAGTYAVGGIVGYVQGVPVVGGNPSIVSECTSETSVKADVNVGGIAGVASSKADFSKVINKGSITARTGIGGAVGYMSGTSSLTESSSSGAVVYDAALGNANFVIAGGLIGQIADNGTVTKSFSTGSVNTSTGTASDEAGGLVGYISNNNGQVILVENSYATGAVAGRGSRLGALLGSTNCLGACTIRNTHAIGSVSSILVAPVNVGGLLGLLANNLTVVSSYWNPVTTGQPISPAGTQLNSAQMAQTASFGGWDFTTIWIINNGQYPTLR